MNYRMFIGCTAFVGLSSTTALAQNTVGEVLDAGGKKLTKDEFVAAIVDSNISGPTQGGGQVQVNYKADGTFAGNVQSAQGKNGGRYGTWTIDVSGKLCTDATTSVYGTRQNQGCAFLFKLGDRYFVAVDTDTRDTRVLPRAINK
jgi:hypothetical protein